MSAELRVLVGPAGAIGLDGYMARTVPEPVLRLGGIQALAAEDGERGSTPAAVASLYAAVLERLAAGELVVVDATDATAADRAGLLAVARETTGVQCTTAVLVTAGVVGRVRLADGAVLEASMSASAGGVELVVVHRYPDGRQRLCSVDQPPIGGVDRIAAQRLAEAGAWLAAERLADPASCPSVRQLMAEGWRQVLDVDPAGWVVATYTHAYVDAGRCPQCAADDPRRTCRTHRTYRTQTVEGVQR